MSRKKEQLVRLQIFLVLAVHVSNAFATTFPENAAVALLHIKPKLETQSECKTFGDNKLFYGSRSKQCPCTLILDDSQLDNNDNTDYKYAICKKDDVNAWINSGKTGALPVTFTVLTAGKNGGRKQDSQKHGRSLKMDIPHSGEYMLTIQGTLPNAKCISIKYFFESRSKKCPVHLPSKLQSDASKHEIMLPIFRSTRADSKIIQGTSVRSVQIQKFIAGVYNARSGACTGTVIGKRWILTAAHCKMDRGSQVFVGGNAFGYGEQYDVEQVWNHSEYKNGIDKLGNAQSAAVNDIALVKVSRAIKGARAVALNSNNLCPLTDTVTRAVGYGMTLTKRSVHQLNKVDISVVSHSACRDAYKSAMRGRALAGLTRRTHVCAGMNNDCNGGVCRGDSGGPLLVWNENEFVQVGITSFGLDCEYKEFAPDVFTRVSNYVQWIKEMTKDDVTIVHVETKRRRTMTESNRGVATEFDADTRRHPTLSNAAIVGIALATGAALLLVGTACVAVCIKSRRSNDGRAESRCGSCCCC